MAQKIKKKFFDVEIPIIAEKIQLQAYSSEELAGRRIKFDLTRKLKGKSMELVLLVKTKGEKTFASPIKLILMPYFIRRVMRRGTNYVEDSFEIKCKDSKMRIKPLLITRKKVSREVRKALRNKAREELREYAKNKSAETIFSDIVKNQMQRPLSLKLKKIYPLSLCEIRMLEIIQ